MIWIDKLKIDFEVFASLSCHYSLIETRPIFDIEKSEGGGKKAQRKYSEKSFQHQKDFFLRKHNSNFLFLHYFCKESKQNHSFKSLLVNIMTYIYGKNFRFL